jgi:hypothetical protein
MYARSFVMSRRQDGHVGAGALSNHLRMQPLWKACEQPGRMVKAPAASSSMQIGHCAGAIFAASPTATASPDRSITSAPLWPACAEGDSGCVAAAIAEIELEMVASRSASRLAYM